MESTDFSTFDRAFRRVCGAFRLKLKVDEASELTQTYFRLLEAHALDDVLDSGKTLIATAKRFPLAAEWLAVLEARQRTQTRATAAADRRQMTTSELEVWAAAERDRFARPPCACEDCYAAHVDDQELRFVPSLVGPDEYETAWNPRRQAVQIVGHWAHGPELARWYAARADFYRRARPMPRFARLVLVGAREPGEEG